MSITSLNQSATLNAALFPLNRNTDAITASTYRLSSGNRFFRAGDDVGSLSVATRMQSQVTSLRQALLNSAQANSLLQVAYGGLSQISDILDTQRALATQANSGSLSDTERAFLDIEFQNNLQEIDRIANTTSFNGLRLLDGSISNDNAVNTVSSRATQATGQLVLNANPTAGQTIILNGVTLTANTSFTIGATTADTVQNLATALNASTNTALSSASYSAAGNVLTITDRSGGLQGRLFRISEAGTANDTAVGDATLIPTSFTLQNGTDNGLYRGGTVASGSVNDTIVNTQNQTAAQTVLTFSGNPANGQSLNIDDGNGGTIAFTFVTAAPVSNTEIQIGATTSDTIRNAIEVLSNYTGTNDYVVRQLEFVQNNQTLTIRGRLPGNVLDLAGANADITEGLTNVVITNTEFSNGVNTGVNVSGVSNPAFAGSIGGFTASFNSVDNVSLSLTVGSSTYSGVVADTTPAANTFVRLNSSNGGYFDIELRGGAGLSVTNTSTAQQFANRISNAFSGLSFTQDRPISSFSGTGNLVGASAFLRSDTFTNLRASNVNVTGSISGDATLEVIVNGETFRSNAGIGNRIGARQEIALTNITNPNRVLSLVNGPTAIDLSSQSAAESFETQLRNSLGITYNGTGELSFAVGASAADTLGVRINGATTARLFNGNAPNITTQPNAASAVSAIDSALSVLGNVISEVGSSQARLAFTDSNLSSSITNVDSARAALADTDIPSESTRYASLLVQQQAGIAVLAQVQSLSSSLVDLLRVNLNR